MNSYFEQMILSASPVELVRLLYRRAISLVRSARQHLRDGNIAERSAAINNAWAILVELASSLRTEGAEELSSNLRGLYCYMQERLLEANLKQADAPLAETLSLLLTLSEAWEQVSDAQQVSSRTPERHFDETPRSRWSAGVPLPGESVRRVAVSA